MLSHLLSRASRRAGVAALAASFAILFAAGCAPDHKARGVVKGKVTSRGKHLTTGTVMFINKEGMTGQATIQVDGTYEMPDAPVGDCKVTVSVSKLPNDPSVMARIKGKGPAMPSGPVDPSKGEPPAPPAAKIPKEVVRIDDKFADPETSGLTFTVKKGETHTYNIDL